MAEHSQQIADLQGQINQLSAQLQALSTQFYSCDPFRFRARSQSRSRFPRSYFSRSPSQPRLSPYCWYHELFGNAAIKCNPSFTFLSSSYPPASQPAPSHWSSSFTFYIYCKCHCHTFYIHCQNHYTAILHFHLRCIYTEGESSQFCFHFCGVGNCSYCG